MNATPQKAALVICLHKLDFLFACSPSFRGKTEEQSPRSSLVEIMRFKHLPDLPVNQERHIIYKYSCSNLSQIIDSLLGSGF